MPDRPRLFFDYVDPLSWLVDRAVTGLEEEGGEPVERHPLELRPPPRPLLDPDEPSWLERWEEARRISSTPLRPPALVPWTRKAHELALLAREKGRFAEVHESLFRAFVLEGRDVGRVDILVALAVQSGLDATETRAALDVDRHAEAVEALREEAERLRVRGVPTLLAGGKRIEGLPAPGELVAVLRRS